MCRLYMQQWLCVPELRAGGTSESSTAGAHHCSPCALTLLAKTPRPHSHAVSALPVAAVLEQPELPLLLLLLAASAAAGAAAL
jgi:hypothetical protein